MGGPFRAIVGGQVSYRWSFPPAQGVRFNNYSVIYGHAVDIDEYIAPGQIGMVVPCDPPITGLTFIFEQPPNSTQAAPIAGQVLQMTTYDAAPAGVPLPPLGPDVGLILPIGLDQPKHLHHFTGTHAHNPHLHGHSATHAHTSATHAHGHSTTHFHTQPQHAHLEGTLISNTGPASAGTAHTHAYNDAGAQTTFLEGDQNTGNTAPGNTDNATPANTGASSPGNTDNANVPAASPGDSDLENLQHTHP